jgi:hypothetical protein
MLIFQHGVEHMEEVVSLRQQLVEAQTKLDTTVEFVHALCQKLGVIPEDLVEEEEQPAHKAAS